jgi:hypothetical protein
VLDLLRAGFLLAEGREQRRQLADLVERLFTIVRFQQPRLRTLVQDEVIAARDNPKPLEDTAADLTSRYLEDLATPSPPPEGQPITLAAAWEALAQVTIDAWPTLERLAKAQQPDDLGDNGKEPRSAATLTGRRRAAAARLTTYLAYLGPDRDPETVQLRIFDLYLAERAMLPVEAAAEQRVELVQLSANTRTALAPRFSTAHHKLTGVQLHHFGAFYKSSWRANDWMWGRLDGAGWLVHLLLDPRRIHTVAQLTATELGLRPSEWFYDELKRRIGGRDPGYRLDGAGGSQFVDADAVTAERHNRRDRDRARGRQGTGRRHHPGSRRPARPGRCPKLAKEIAGQLRARAADGGPGWDAPQRGVAAAAAPAGLPPAGLPGVGAHDHAGLPAGSRGLVVARRSLDGRQPAG